MELRIDVGPSIQLMRGLEEGEYDFVIGRLLPDSDAEAFQIVPGKIERVRCLVRHGHPLAGRRHVPLADLKEHPWIIQERGTPIRQAVEAAFIGKGLTVPDDVIATSSLVLMMALIPGSDLIAPMSLEVARLMEETSGGVLASLDLDIPIEVSPYHVITRRDRRLSPAAQNLYAMVIEEITRARV
ncbi:MAG: LysR substrate-binding domain-containing protein [Micropruina sp.]|uniref:LysR substrate-binding domain-containing protein n=1 Tax=Micropruina sp. TaxID=2737536 RepID=UPI0039E2FA70